MRDETDRDLTILSANAKNNRVTQRHLAREPGVALSLANLCLRRLAVKGLIRVINIRPNRPRHIFTPKGFAEKSRLTYAYMCRTFDPYREALRPPSETGYKRIAFYGTGQAAKVAYLCLTEGELVPAEFDRIVLTSFGSQEATEARVEELLRAGASRDQILTLHR
jgi:hypothetical protein